MDYIIEFVCAYVILEAVKNILDRLEGVYGSGMADRSCEMETN